jgi:GTPase SAR1 family protein
VLTFSVWDFAGQTVYYNTHQFFLSDRAVYLLLWNIRLGHEHAGLDFWLSSISVHAPKAPIFVVGTHVDQVWPHLCGGHAR